MKASQGTKLCSYFDFFSLYDIWTDQLYRLSRSEFHEWLFGPEKFSGLSRNGPQGRRVCGWPLEKHHFDNTACFARSQKMLPYIFRKFTDSQDLPEESTFVLVHPNLDSWAQCGLVQVNCCCRPILYQEGETIQPCKEKRIIIIVFTKMIELYKIKLNEFCSNSTLTQILLGELEIQRFLQILDPASHWQPEYDNIRNEKFFEKEINFWTGNIHLHYSRHGLGVR